MSLGVVLHAANVYSAAAGWVISDPRRSIAFDLISDAIHVFRMPSFFWISGFFCAMTFERYGVRGLLRRRIPRLAIPMLSTWLTLNVIQNYYVAYRAGRDPVAAVLRGVPVGHLWFLGNLIVYVAVAALVLAFLPVKRTVANSVPESEWPIQLIALAVANFALIVIARLTGIAYVPLFALTNIYGLANYGPFFAVGLLMYWQTDMRDAFLRTPPAMIVLALPLALAANLFQIGHGRIIGEMAHLTAIFATWLSIASLLALFRRIFQRGSPVTRLLSEASYSVYLFHQLVVIVLGLALIGVDVSPWVKFALVSVGTLLVTLAMHILFVRRFRVIRLLFNGRT